MGVSRPIVVALLVAAAIAAAALITYKSISSEGPSRDKAVLIGLRLALVATLLFCLIKPTLILKAAVPQQNFLGVLIDDSRSMPIADRDGQPRSAVRPAAARRTEQPRCSTRCRSASSCASSASRRPPIALRLAGRSEVRRHGHAARRRARARARRALRPAARRAGDGHRRRRHVGRLARRVARQPEGALDSGVHGRRRPGALRARHPGHARRDAAHRPQRHVARRRRRALARPATAARRCRSTSKTMGGSSARRR